MLHCHIININRFKTSLNCKKKNNNVRVTRLYIVKVKFIQVKTFTYFTK